MALWNKNTQDFLNQERSLFEVYNIADHWGNQTDWRPQFSDNNRLKVAPFQTVFFNTFQYGKETDVWDESLVGVATATHNANSSNVVMEVGSTAGSKVVRQTKNVMRYIPGRPATLAFSVRLEAPQVGIRRRFGLFDENDGAYFEDDGGTYSYVIRSSTSGITTERRVTREEWNGEKFDGNGYTGVTGVAGTHYLYQGSNSLIQEGEPEKLGTLLSISNPITGTTMLTANVFYPIISLRLKADELQAVMLLRSLQAVTNDNTNVYWRLLENATLTGASWTDHPDPNSFMQYDTTATAVTGGTTLLSGFTIAGGASLVDIDSKATLQLGRSGIGTISDSYTLACASPNTNKAALAVLNWIEQR